jgi:hypothetical protein
MENLEMIGESLDYQEIQTVLILYICWDFEGKEDKRQSASRQNESIVKEAQEKMRTPKTASMQHQIPNIKLHRNKMISSILAVS